MLEALRDFLGSIGPGTWPEWFAAVGTTAAFIVAAIAYLRDVRARRWAQARLVYVMLDELTFHPPGAVVPFLPDGAGVGHGDVPWLPLRDGGPPTTKKVVLEAAGVATASVHNGSDELFGPALVRAYGRTGIDVPWEFEVPAGPVPPHSTSIVGLLCSNPHFPDGEPSVFLEVTFRDSTGRWWRRRGYEPVKRARDRERQIRRAKRRAKRRT